MDLKVVHQSIQVQVLAKLREAIFTGRFQPGEKLVEAQLCRDMGVSRSSIREALRSLESEKLVTIIPNRGPSVTVIRWAEAEAIYQVRALLEGEAMALFASRVSREEVRLMTAALDTFADAVRSGDAVLRLTSTERFYDVVLKGCGNPVIGEMIQGLLGRISFLRMRSMSLEGRSRESAIELRRILAALETHNPEAARQAAIAHVKAASEVVRSFDAEQDAA